MTVNTKYPLLNGLGANPALPYAMARRLLGHPVGCRSVARSYAGIDAELRSVILELGQPYALGELAESPLTPTAVRWRLAAHEDRWVRVACAYQSGGPAVLPGCEVPDELIVRLAADPDPKVRLALTWRPGLPAHVFGVLASDRDPRVREGAIPRLVDPSESQIRALVADPDLKVRAAAVGNVWRWSAPEDLTAALLADPATRAVAAERLPLTPEQVRQFVHDDDEMVRAVAAADPQLADAYVLLHDDPSQEVRVALSTREDVSDEQRVLLWDKLHDEEPQFKGDRFPATAYIDMMWATREMGWLRTAPTATRERHVRSPLAFIRCVAASVGDLSSETVMELLAEPDCWVRQVVAVIYAEQLPGEVLRRVVEECGEPISFGPRLTTHEHFPAEAFAEWVTRTAPDDAHLLYLGASLGKHPADVVARLAVHESGSVRAAAARQESVSPAVLEQLLADPEPAVAQAAAESPVLPVSAMEKILSDAGL